jgi:hypothetical protein
LEQLTISKDEVDFDGRMAAVAFGSYCQWLQMGVPPSPIWSCGGRFGRFRLLSHLAVSVCWLWWLSLPMLAGCTSLLVTGFQVLRAADGDFARLDTPSKFPLPLSQPFGTQINAAASRLFDRTRIL